MILRVIRPARHLRKLFNFVISPLSNGLIASDDRLIVFVALMKHYALDDKLTPAMWAGVGIIGVAVLLVGLSSLVDTDAAEGSSDVALGVGLTIAGTFMQSLQYVYEEKVWPRHALTTRCRPLFDERVSTRGDASRRHR